MNSRRCPVRNAILHPASASLVACSRQSSPPAASASASAASATAPAAVDAAANDKASCHTAAVGSHPVEGHLPAEDIKRLLAQQPAASEAGVAWHAAGLARHRPDRTRWLIAPAFAVLAAGLFLVPKASNFTLMLVVIGAVAASAGILSPILTYWTSAKAGTEQGWHLGKQAAAASLGITLGSAVGGLLFSVAALPGASFILAAGLTIVAFLLSLGISHSLVPSSRGKAFASEPP